MTKGDRTREARLTRLAGGRARRDVRLSWYIYCQCCCSIHTCCHFGATSSGWRARARSVCFEKRWSHLRLQSFNVHFNAHTDDNKTCWSQHHSTWFIVWFRTSPSRVVFVEMRRRKSPKFKPGKLVNRFEFG